MWWFAAVAFAGGGGPCWMGKAPYPGNDSLEYVSADAAAERERKAAEAEMREPGPRIQNGIVLVKIARASIDLASASNHVVIIESAGREVVRHEEPPDVPDTQSGYYGWLNVIGVQVPDEATFPITVHAADKVLADRCTWTIAADGTVKRVK